MGNDGSSVSFYVDTRKNDLTWSVEASQDLQSWMPVISSDGGTDWTIQPGQENLWRFTTTVPRPPLGVQRILMVELQALGPSAAAQFYRVRVFSNDD